MKTKWFFPFVSSFALPPDFRLGSGNNSLPARHGYVDDHASEELGSVNRVAPIARVSRGVVVTWLGVVSHLASSVPLQTLQADRRSHDVSGQALYRCTILGLHPYPIGLRRRRRRSNPSI